MPEWMRLGFGLLFCLGIILAAIQDVVFYRIPNLLSYGLGVIFIPYAYFDWPSLPLLSIVINALVVFVCCTVFWLLKWLGAGDVKLLTTTSLWIPPDQIMIFVLLVSVFAMAFIAILRANKRWNPWIKSRPFPEFVKALIDKSDRAIPYGLPIAMSALVVVVPDLLS